MKYWKCILLKNCPRAGLITRVYICSYVHLVTLIMKKLYLYWLMRLARALWPFLTTLTTFWPLIDHFDGSDDFTHTCIHACTNQHDENVCIYFSILRASLFCLHLRLTCFFYFDLSSRHQIPPPLPTPLTSLFRLAIKRDYPNTQQRQPLPPIQPPPPP